MMLFVKNNLAAATAVGLIAALGASCSRQAPKGEAKIGVSFKTADTAKNITKITLTVGPGTGTPSFPNIVVDMTDQDLTNKLSWTAYVQGIPAGTGRTFHIDAYEGTVIHFTGDATATITAGATANVYMLLQGPNDGGSSNFLPVLDSLTASASTVTTGTPSPTVTLYFKAHDPDTGDVLTFAWSDTCSGTSFSTASGTADQVNGNSTTWTGPSSVPPGGACTVSVTVTDSALGSVTAYLAIQVQSPTTGNAAVNAYPNSWPMISGVSAHETFTKNSSGQIVAVDFDLTASATDADGDDVTYSWKSPNCAGGFTSAVVTTATTTLAFGPGQNSNSTVHFHTADITDACVIQVDVTDSWKNGIVPLNSGLPVARGGDTVGLINASVPRDYVIGPQITKVDSPGAPASDGTFVVQKGQVVALGVETFDPTPSFNPAQTPFTFAWTQSGGALGTEVDNTASPGKSTNSWTANAASFVPGSFVKVVVTNKAGLQTSFTWNFSPANPCDGSAGSVGLSCNTGLGLCAPNGKCTAAGTCVDPGAVVCATPDQCHNAGTCNPSSGVCSNPTKTDGTTCNDANACTQVDTCQAGVCVGSNPVTCTAQDQCHTAGTCDTGTGVCSNPAKADGTTCDDGNACTQTDSCQAGTCVGSNPVVCTALDVCHTAGTCSTTSGLCSNPTKADGTSCNTAGACTTGQTCTAGTCSGGTAFCPANQSCNPTGPTCSPTAVAPQAGKDLQISPPAAIAMDSTGAAYLAGSIFSLSPVSFDGHPVASTGGADIFLAKYDPTTHSNVWARGYGDALGNDQNGTGAGVTADGTLAVIGNFAGQMTFGTSTINSSSPIDFLVAVSSSNGNGIWAKQFNDGTNGRLAAVAVNPSLNRVAVCGLFNGATTAAGGAGATDLVPGAVYGGGQSDVIIGMFNSAGTLLWSHEFGGINEEECDSLAIDDAGDLYAAGKFDGASLNLGLATSLTGPNASTRRALWVAKFNGTTGATISQASFTGSAGQATPNSIAVDSTGKLIVAGAFTSTLTFDGTTLTSAGGSDAFVAKLDPANATPFTPSWSVRLGGTGGDAVNGVAVSSFGDVIATGLFNKTTTGAATLTANGTTASDIFVLKLSGTTGSTDFAAGYGDPATQTGDAIAVNRFGSGSSLNLVDFTGTLNGSATFPSPMGTITAAGATDAVLVFSQLQ